MNTKASGLLLQVGVPLVRTTVRFARKPRWLPMAKSKMYKIMELPYQPVHEEEEISRLVNNYQLYNRSLWTFQAQLTSEEDAASRRHTDEGSEGAEYERMLVDVQRDNAIVREIREKQLVQEWKEMEEDILRKKEQLEEERLRELEKNEERLMGQMSKLKNIITEDQLEEAIEKALATVVDYNYGLDKHGKVYRGRTNSDKAEDMSSSLKDPNSVKLSMPVVK